MANLNSCNFSGRLAKDPEIRDAGGKTVAQFSIGVSGYKKDETTWIDCVCWEKTAEVVQSYLHKGSFVVVAGRMKQRTWEAQDGTKRSKLELTVNDLDLGPKQQTEERKPRGGWDD
jgi:single-strand DNA-binding protein